MRPALSLLFSSVSPLFLLCFVGVAGSVCERERRLVDERKELQMMAGWRASFGCWWDDLETPLWWW